MPDFVVDAHRRATPIDHPDGSVTRAKLSQYAAVRVFFTRLAFDSSTYSTVWDTLLTLSFSLDRTAHCLFIGTLSSWRDAAGETHARLLIDNTIASHSGAFESEGTSYAPDVTTISLIHAAELAAGSHQVALQWKTTAGAIYCRPISQSAREGAAIAVIAVY